jgi:RNA polymerase sigma-70 factor, ECF subfamily
MLQRASTNPARLNKKACHTRLLCAGMPLDLRRLYDDHASALFAFALNVTRSESETRDILQDVFSKIASRPELMDDVREERGWLLRMAHRLALDAFRRRAGYDRLIERASAEPLPIFASSEDPDERAFRDAVAVALAELPEEQRAVVHLKLWEEMTFAEIGEALGISINTAASRYRYALDKLQTLLRPLYEELK